MDDKLRENAIFEHLKLARLQICGGFDQCD